MKCQWLGLMVAGVLLSGCANMAHLPHSSHVERDLLEDYRAVSAWSAEEMAAGLQAREQAYALDSGGINRIRLALALGFGKGGGGDVKRSLQLLEEGATAGAEQKRPEALFAEVFAGLLRERLQGETKITTLGRQLESANRQVESVNRQLEGASRQVESERSRAAELEKKLEALKSIEKSLRKR